MSRKTVQSNSTRRSAKKEAILDAAASTFMEHGYSATSIDDIADLLGSTKGRIYYYYKSKADLFYAIHSEAMRINLETMEPIATGDGSPTERLTEMLYAQFDLITSHFPMQRVTITGIEMHLQGRTTPGQRVLVNEIIAQRDRYERLFVTVIKEGIKTGEFRKSNPRVTVKPVLGATNWMTTWYRPREDDTARKLRKIANETVELLMYGMQKTGA